MRNTKTKLTVAALIISTLSGCAHVIQNLTHLPDYAFMIDGKPYLVNSELCSEIRSIAANGDLECYTADGVKTATEPALSSSRIWAVRELGFEWGSAEHNAMVYDWVYNGGAMRAASATVNSASSALDFYNQMNDTLDSIAELDNIEDELRELRSQQSMATIRGGYDAWHVHQQRIINFHINNITKFK